MNLNCELSLNFDENLLLNMIGHMKEHLYFQIDQDQLQQNVIQYIH